MGLYFGAGVFGWLTCSVVEELTAVSMCTVMGHANRRKQR